MAVIVPLSILLPIFIGAVQYRQLTPQSRVLFWYLVITGLINGLSILIGRVFHINNMPVVHVYTAIEMGILTYYYKLLMGKGERSRIFYSIPVVFLVLCIVNAVFFQSIHTYNSYTRSVEAMVCMLFALNYFAKLASDQASGSVIRSADFYANAGIFLYYSGAFVLFVFSNFIITKLSKTNFLIIWNMHAAMLLIMYLCLSLSFLLCKK